MGQNSFYISVYSNVQNIDESVAINLIRGDSTEEYDIDGHHVFFLKNKYDGTSLIFESAGKLVVIEIPNSHGLTDTGKNMVKSTPKSTMTNRNTNNTYKCINTI